MLFGGTPHGEGAGSDILVLVFLTPNHALNLPPAPELNRENNPYRGLEAFDAQHRDLFFGRDKEIERLLAGLEAPNPLTVILGASGTGKSSLVKAGLLPRIAAREDFCVLPTVRPANTPLKALADAFAGLSAADNQACKQLLEQFRTDENALVSLLDKWKAAHPDRKLLLFIDQTEELITQSASPKESFQFQQLIKRVMAKHWDCLWIVATLRLDFEAQFQDEALREEWMDARFVIPPMTQAQLREAIELPAAARVLYFEPSSLVDRLIEDVAQTPGALPLLSFTLSEMYLRYLERRSDNRALTEENYRALGGVAGSLTQRATKEYDALIAESPDYAQTIKHVMLRMVAVEGGELARRRVPLSELVYEDEQENRRVQKLIDKFVAARLIVRGQDARSSQAREPYVEPAHDALVRGWDKLLRWKNAEQEGLGLQRRLAPIAMEWSQQHREKGLKKLSKGLLWNDNPRLGLLREVLASEQNWLNKAESEFVESSHRLRRSRRMRFVGSLFGVIAALSGLSVGLTLTAQNLDKTSKRNLAERMVAEAELLVEQSSVKQKAGALLAVRAYGILGEIGEESGRVNQVLRKSLEVLPAAQTFEHAEGIRAIALTSTTLATASKDNTAILWTIPEDMAQRPQPSHTLQHEGSVNAIAFTPDASQVITASSDQTAIVWNAQTGVAQTTIAHEQPVRSLQVSPKDGAVLVTLSGNRLGLYETGTGKSLQAALPFAVNSTHPADAVRFSADGSQLAAADAQGRVVLWMIEGTQVSSPRLLRTVGKKDNRMDVTAIAFSPDGSKLAVAGRGGSLLVLDARNGQTLFSKSLEEVVNDVRFSASGEQIAIAVLDETARIFSVQTGQETHRFEHEDAVKSVRFSPDDKSLLTTSWNESAQIWNIGTGRVSNTLSSEDEVTAAQFRPVEQGLDTISYQVVTASEDGAARLWNTSPKSDAVQLVHKDSVRVVDFGSADGQLVVTASHDGAVSIWDSQTEEIVQKIPLPKGTRALTLQVSSDCKRIVIVGSDRTVRLWDVESQQYLFEKQHDSELKAVSLYSQGSLVATASDDKKARVFDDKGNLLAELPHKQGVIDVRFSRDGKRLATASFDQEARVWNVETVSLEARLAHTEIVRQVVFSPNGRYLATAGDSNKATLWDLKAQTPVASAMHSNVITAVRFNPDGDLLVTGSRDHTAKLWRITLDGEPALEHTKTLKHRRIVNTVSFNRKGNRLVTASADGTAFVWNVASGRRVIGLSHEAEVISANFSPDGALIATASKDGVAKVGGSAVGDLDARVCDRIGRNPTVQDWVQYMTPEIDNQDIALQSYDLVCPQFDPHPSVIRYAKNRIIEGQSRPARSIFKRLNIIAPAEDLDPTTPEKERSPEAIVQATEAVRLLNQAKDKARSGDRAAAQKYYKQALRKDDSVESLEPDLFFLRPDTSEDDFEAYFETWQEEEFSYTQSEIDSAEESYVAWEYEDYSAEDEFYYLEEDTEDFFDDDYDEDIQQDFEEYAIENFEEYAFDEIDDYTLDGFSTEDFSAEDFSGDNFGGISVEPSDYLDNETPSSDYDTIRSSNSTVGVSDYDEEDYDYDNDYDYEGDDDYSDSGDYSDADYDNGYDYDEDDDYSNSGDYSEDDDYSEYSGGAEYDSYDGDF